MSFKTCLSGTMLATLLGTVPAASCGNDMTKARGDFIQAFTICQETLRKRQARLAQACIAGLEDRLDIFADHLDQTMLLSDYWYVSGLASLTIRRRNEGKQAFEKSNAFGPNTMAEKALSNWRQMIKRNRKDLLAEAYQVVTHRIDAMRNPRIKGRAASNAVPGKTAGARAQAVRPGQKQLTTPDIEARDVIFGEAGLAAAIKAADLDELDKDMLFMKAARLDVAILVKTYQDKFEAKMLAKLADRARHYYGLDWKQQKAC